MDVANLPDCFGASFSVLGFTLDGDGVTWTKAAGGGTWTFSESGGTLTFVGGIPSYDAWATAKGLDGTAGKENGFNDDPDKDGRNNLEEFAFDGDPRSGVNEGKVVGKVATLPSDGGKVLTLTLPVRAGATFGGATEQVSAAIDGIVYTVQGSDTLEAASWNLVIAEVTGSDALAVQAGLPTLSARAGPTAPSAAPAPSPMATRATSCASRSPSN